MFYLIVILPIIDHEELLVKLKVFLENQLTHVSARVRKYSVFFFLVF